LRASSTGSRRVPSSRASLLLLQPVVRARHNPRSIILGRMHLNAMQPRRGVRRTERDQIPVARILRRKVCSDLEM